MMYLSTQTVLDRAPPANNKRIDTAAPKRPIPRTTNRSGNGCGCLIGCALLLLLIAAAIYYFFWN